MSLNSARKGWIQVGSETTFGSPATGTDNVFWTTNTLEGITKPIENSASYGLRNKVFSAVPGQKWGAGDLEFNLDVNQSGYFYAAALGSTNSVTVSGSVKSHTHSVNQANTPYSLSIYKDRVVDRQLFTGATVDTIETKVSNGLATAKTTLMSLFPVTTTSGSVTPASGTLFTWANYTVQFGSNYAAASAAAATPITDIDFTIKNNSETIFESGQTTATRIGVKDFESSGNMTLYFESTTDRDAFYNLTGRAMIVKFLGAGSGSTQEKLQFNNYNTYNDTFSVETGIDAFFIEKQSWVCDYSVSDSKTMDIVQVNSNSNY